MTENADWSRKRAKKTVDGRELGSFRVRGGLRTVNFCEMKYTNGEFVIDADYERDLRNKVDAYQRETGTEDTILLTMITARGVKANSHSDCVQKSLVAEDLFRE